MSYPVTYAVRFRDGEPVGGAGEPGAPGAGAGWEAVAPAALITRVGFDVDDVAPRAPAHRSPCKPIPSSCSAAIGSGTSSPLSSVRAGHGGRDRLRRSR